MNKTTTGLMAAKRVAVAVATVCATLAAPAYATDDVKNVLDLMLKKGVISQQDYDQFMKDNADAAENKQFKEQRLDKDISKANAFIQKNAEAGQVMKNGLGIQSADGKYSVQFIGRVHMDYRSFSQDSTAADTDTDKFDYRRARFGIRGKLTNDFEYMLFANVTDGSTIASSQTVLDEGYLTYVGFKPAQVRLGKFKMPFGLEQLTSSNNIDFMERSISGIEGEFIPAKQQGAMLFGSPMSGFSYAAALSVGANKSATIDKPEFIGRVSANFAELMGNKDVVTHLGMGYSVGEISTLGTAISGNHEGRATTKPFTSVTITGPADRTRQNLELALAYNAFKLQGEYFDFKYDQASGTELGAKGMYVQGMWNITGENHNYSNSSGTFGWIKPKSEFSTSKGGTGAWQAGLRFSKIDGSDGFGAANKNKADSMTVGLNWIANSNVRFMLNYVVTDYAVAISGVSKDKALNLRAQVSF